MSCSRSTISENAHLFEILLGVGTYRRKTGEEDDVPATCRQLLEDSVERLFALPDFKPASTDAGRKLPRNGCHANRASKGERRRTILPVASRRGLWQRLRRLRWRQQQEACRTNFDGVGCVCILRFLFNQFLASVHIHFVTKANFVDTLTPVLTCLSAKVLI